MPVDAAWSSPAGAIEGYRPHLERARPTRGAQFLWTWMAADVFVVLAFLGLHFMAVRSRYDLRYLPPSAFRSLMALAEVLVLRKDRDIAPAEVAGRVDRYLASFRAREKTKILPRCSSSAYWPVAPAAPAVPSHVARPAPALDAAPLPRRRLATGCCRADPDTAGRDPHGAAVLLLGLLRRRARGQQGGLRAVLAPRRIQGGHGTRGRRSPRSELHGPGGLPGEDAHRRHRDRRDRGRRRDARLRARRAWPRGPDARARPRTSTRGLHRERGRPAPGSTATGR